MVLEAGNRYTYTVSVNATGLTLEGCTIGGWTDGGSENGTAEDLGYFIQDDGSYTVYTANGLKEWAEAVQTMGRGCADRPDTQYHPHRRH